MLQRREATAVRSLLTAAKSSACSLQLGKSQNGNKGPAQPKIKLNQIKKKYNGEGDRPRDKNNDNNKLYVYANLLHQRE